jgi:hypothetical protein
VSIENGVFKVEHIGEDCSVKAIGQKSMREVNGQYFRSYDEAYRYMQDRKF